MLFLVYFTPDKNYILPCSHWFWGIISKMMGWGLYFPGGGITCGVLPFEE